MTESRGSLCHRCYEAYQVDLAARCCALIAGAALGATPTEDGLRKLNDSREEWDRLRKTHSPARCPRCQRKSTESP